MAFTNCVTVVLGQCTVTDHKELYILEQTATCPETVALVTIDLIECLAHVDATPLELHVHHRKTIDQNRYVISIDLVAFCFVLVDNLEVVVVNVLFVDQVDVLERYRLPA